MGVILLIVACIYSVFGLFIGSYALSEKNWPKKRLVEDRVVGLASYQTICWTRTILFLILMGPLFWIVCLATFLSESVMKLLD
jgi:hypothetical protein